MKLCELFPFQFEHSLKNYENHFYFPFAFPENMTIPLKAASIISISSPYFFSSIWFTSTPNTVPMRIPLITRMEGL